MDRANVNGAELECEVRGAGEPVPLIDIETFVNLKGLRTVHKPVKP